MDLKNGAGLILGTSRGRRRRGKSFARDHGTVEKENRALEMLVKGMKQIDIAAELEMAPSSVSAMIKRALEYRARALGPTVEVARGLILERYERLLERWWPLATGDYLDEETGITDNPPNPRAVDVVLKILEAMARLTGADKGRVETPAPNPAFVGGIHVHTGRPVERQQAIADVLDILRTTRTKNETIEGQLADARTSLAELTDGTADDRPGPPPTRKETAA